MDGILTVAGTVLTCQHLLLGSVLRDEIVDERIVVWRDALKLYG
jgi:hypothetical protein